MMKKKSSFAKRYQTSYESRDKGGVSRVGVMDWKKVEGDISFYVPVEGRNRINIIPYEIKSKNHPLVKRGEFEVGESDYVMDIYVHRGVGPTEASVLCLKSTYGKPCPICEQSALLRKQGKEEEADALKPSRRVFYNVQDLKEPDVPKIFETSHFLFEKELIDEARNDEGEGGFVDFADPEDGKEIKFRANKVKKGNFEFLEYKSFSFEDRDEPLSKDLLKSAVSFDEIMNVPTYEEAQKILFGQDEDEENDDESVKKPSVEDDADEEDEEDDEDEKPAKSAKSKKRVEDEDEDDEEEDEEPKSKPKKSSEGGCKFGHCFGKDCDKFGDCDECDNWDKCVKAK